MDCMLRHRHRLNQTRIAARTVVEGSRAMDERRVIKALLRPQGERDSDMVGMNGMPSSTTMCMRMGWIAIALSLRLARPAMGQEVSTMKVRLTIAGKAVEATWLDNATARACLALLPMTLTLEDYASTDYDSDAFAQTLLHTANQPGAVRRNRGDVAAAFAQAAQRLSADYYVPHFAHSPIEPPAATARWRKPVAWTRRR